MSLAELSITPWLTPRGFAGGTPWCAERINHISAHNLVKRYPIELYKSGRILTPRPLSTPFGLDLGSTNPPLTNRAEETLDFRRPGFSPGNATYTDILTSLSSTLPYGLSFIRQRTLPYHPCGFTVSVCILSPVTFSAQSDLASELLRTLSRMAASEPTFWVSESPHFLSHLNTT